MKSRSERAGPARTDAHSAYDSETANLRRGVVPDTGNRILVVHPDAGLRENLRRCLGTYAVFAAANGRQGMEQADRERLDLVILNWELPDMEGEDALSHLKGIHPATPVIVTSRSRSMEWPIAAFRAGAKDCFPLPPDPGRLRNTVGTILRGACTEPSPGLRPKPPRTPTAEDTALSEISIRSPLRIRRAMNYVWASEEDAPSVARIAREAALSPRQFRREFRRATGMSPRQYIMQVRLAKAKAMLRAGASVTEAAFAIGYDDLTGLERAFRKLEDCTPREYRSRYLR